MNLKKLNQDNLPMMSIDTTQARGVYNLIVSPSNGVDIYYTLNEKGLADLEEDIKIIREHEKFVKNAEKRASIKST